MTYEQIKNSISHCGLICCFCKVKENCDCRTNNHCCKRLLPEGCYQYDCCRGKGLNGCWECPNAPCDNGVFNKNNLWLRTFIKCIKEDGIENFSQYILRNFENGIIYTTYSHGGDYGLDNEADILTLLRTGVSSRPK